MRQHTAAQTKDFFSCYPNLPLYSCFFCWARDPLQLSLLLQR